MGMDFRGLVWKRDVENDIFWSEIGLGFEKPWRHTPTKNSQEYPPRGA